VRRWIRLDAQWDDTEWVMLLGPLSQLAWVKLLCYVKRDGRRGTVHALTAKAAAKKWGVTVQAVEDMIFQARQDGALRCEVVDEREKWVVTKWVEYQEPDPTNVARQRLFRQRNGSNALLTRDTVARDHRPPTCDNQTAEPPPAKVGKKRKTQLPDDWQPLERHLAKAKEICVNCDLEVAKFRGYHGGHGNTRLDWNKSFDTWLLNAAEYAQRQRRAPTSSEGIAVTPRQVEEWQAKKRDVEAWQAGELERLTKAAAQRNGSPSTAKEPSGPLAGVLARVVGNTLPPEAA
jgi:hypothetical protein